MKREDIFFQLDMTWQLFQYHINGLGDEECYWCKTPQGLNVCKVGDDWVPDWPDTEEYCIGPASIAWILWHILYWWQSTLSASFKGKKLAKEDVAWPGNIQVAIEKITECHDVWIEKLSSMMEAEFESTEKCCWPFENENFVRLALWLNNEFMKNVAEIGAARFLYATVQDED